eukprot:3693270-Pyramimonas_sp.AAC.1
MSWSSRTSGVAMAWSWALWAVRSSVACWVSEALPGGARRLLLDERPAPVAASQHPARSVYADNASPLGLSSAGVDTALDRPRGDALSA